MSSNQPICLIGFDRDIEDLIRMCNRAYAGFVDPKSQDRPGYLGTDDDVAQSPYEFAFGMLLPRVRQLLYPRYRARLTSLVSPLAYVAPDAQIGDATTIQHRSTIMPEAKIGHGAQLHVGVTVHHDVEVGPFCSLASHSLLLGRVVLGEGAFIGGGAVIRDGCRVGARAIVGAGAVVVRDVAEGAVVAGNPARGLPSSGKWNKRA